MKRPPLRTQLASPLPRVRGVAVPAAFTPPPLPPVDDRPQPIRIGALGGDFEAERVTLPVALDLAAVMRSQAERVVYRTARRWRAIDVFVDGIASYRGELLSVFVYAIGHNGGRALVASGRWGHYPFAGPIVDSHAGDVYVCGARAQGTVFEVAIAYKDDNQFAGAGSTVLELPVSIVASDEANEVPEWVGVVPGWNGAMGTIGAAVLLPGGEPNGADHVELVEVTAINTAAAQRYLQVHEVTAAGLVGGEVPIATYDMGAAIGAGVSVRPMIRARPGFGLYTVVSSTAGTYTATADGTVHARIR